jgi:hypothetical protein
MRPGIPCPQRETHLKQYHDAVRAYCEAVVGLDADLPYQEFETVHRRAEEARAIFDRRREELQRHLAMHGCQPDSK